MRLPVESVADDYDLVIEDDVVAGPDVDLDIDPMLLKIYHDESLGHIRDVMAQLDAINNREGEQELTAGFNQTHKFVGKAMKAFGVEI